MKKKVGTIFAVSVLLSMVVQSCSTTKNLNTLTSMEGITHSNGQLEDVIHTTGLKEYWVVPSERNGVVVKDTIRHRIDLNDTVHHRIHVTDTVRSQVLQEQTKGKVKAKAKGLRETMLSKGNISAVPSVALIISIGINTILILVILSVYFLKSNHRL